MVAKGTKQKTDLMNTDMASEVVVEKKRRLKGACNMHFFSRKFLDNVLIKIVASLLSVKVWGLVAITTLASLFLVNGYISGSDWVTVISAVYGVIYAVREVFKTDNISNLYYRIRNSKKEKESDSETDEETEKI